MSTSPDATDRKPIPWLALFLSAALFTLSMMIFWTALALLGTSSEPTVTELVILVGSGILTFGGSGIVLGTAYRHTLLALLGAVHGLAGIGILIAVWLSPVAS